MQLEWNNLDKSKHTSLFNFDLNLYIALAKLVESNFPTTLQKLSLVYHSL